MERVLILGGSGMLGHKLVQVLTGRFETWVTVRRPETLANVRGVAPAQIIGGFDAEDASALEPLWDKVRPTVVINAIGIIKQLAAAKDPVACITINSLFPHRVSRLAERSGARLIHISTDCVFSGHRGNYVESDAPDADDLYGRSKLLGEVTAPGLTLRTSIIGRELGSAHGLVEWFLAQEGRTAKGFTRAIFSGLPTVVLARTIAEVIERHHGLTGLLHVSASPIDKCALLELVRDAYGRRIIIEPDDRVRIDRSLDSSRFRAKTGIVFPPWSELVAQMVGD